MSTMSTTAMKHRTLDLLRPLPLLSLCEDFTRDVEDFGGFVDIYLTLLPHSLCEYITMDV